jgi:hypothetical protein
MNHLYKWQVVALLGTHLHVAQISQLLGCTQNNFNFLMKPLSCSSPCQHWRLGGATQIVNAPFGFYTKKCGSFKTNMSKNTHIHKLVAIWMWMLLNFWLVIVFKESSCCIFGNACNKNIIWRFCMMVCPKFWENYFYIYQHLCLGTNDLNGSYGSLALMFKMKQCVFWHVIKSKCVFSNIRVHIYMKLEIKDSG